MKNMTGGKAVVEALRAEDVRCVFGLIGSATMEVFDALYDANDVRFVGVRGLVYNGGVPKRVKDCMIVR